MNFIILFILSFLLWLIFTWKFDIQNIIIGCFVCLFSSWIFWKEFPYKKKVFQIKRYFYFLLFIFVFIYKVTKASLLMAYRILSPGLPIKPGIVKVPIELKSPMGRVILANAITLTPGTITVEIKKDYLYIHWIYVYEMEDTKKITEDICGTFQRLLKRIFE